jgi:solute carrier family 10 (sodium/bile acid cotransporter), member 7
MTDQASILLVVYVAFGEAVNQGLWQRLPLSMLAGIFALCALMLAIIMVLTTVISRRLGFNKEDEIAILFCGSKKSLASGVPMAKVLFASGAAGAPTLGMILLPIMLFHQLQLMVCAVLAARYARRSES